MIEDIFNYLRIDERIGTAGQPAPEQFADIALSGCRAVINLAQPTSDNAIPNEGEIVTSLGLTYVHLPVDFERPSLSDFEAFSGIMNTFRNHKVFIHCAMNMRVSVFLYMYRVREMNVPRSSAEKDLYKLWKPDAVWQGLINDLLEQP